MTEEKKSDELQRQLNEMSEINQKLMIENLNLRLKIQMKAVTDLAKENDELRNILFESNSTDSESEEEDILITPEEPVEINKKKPRAKPKPKAKSKKDSKKPKKTKKVETE
jgi:hypothetical protein